MNPPGAGRGLLFRQPCLRQIISSQHSKLTVMQADLIVICLCAEWCNNCAEYAPRFQEVARAFPDVRFRWVDIEDEAEAVEPIDVENFPTVLIANDRTAVFLGAITPHPQTLTRLIENALQGDMPALRSQPQAQQVLDNLLESEE